LFYEEENNQSHQDKMSNRGAEALEPEKAHLADEFVYVLHCSASSLSNAIRQVGRQTNILV